MSDQDIRFRIVVEENAGPAAQRTEQAFQRVAGSATAASGQTAAAMRMLPAQLSDVATQLAGGQSPFLVLMQQGLQTRDMFGSFRAMAAGIGSALTPMALGLGGAAAALALVGTAMVSAEREARKLQDMLTLTGNAAGLTADRLRDMSQRVAAGSRASASEAREVVTALAAEGTVSARVLESMAVAAQRVADLSGRSAQDVARDFARMAGGVAEWAAEHNKAWNFLTLEQYRYIKRLEDQGKAEETAIYVSTQLAGRFKTQSENLGYLETAWKKAGEAAQWAWDAMMGWGKADTLAQQIEKARAELQALEGRLADAKNSPLPAGPAGIGMLQREREELRQRLANLQEQERMENRLADTKAANAEQERKRIQAARDKENGRGREKKDPDLMNWNPTGLMVGPPQLFDVDAEDERRNAFRRSELAATEQVNRAMEEAALRRAETQRSLLADLVRANEDANLQLIADDEARALAQVTLERSRLQQQIEQVYGSSEARAAAEAAADAAADARRRGVAQRFARDTALITREETRDALARAFQDSRNPIRAFGDALGNIVFQRVSTKLADAILQSSSLDFIGRAGSFLGDLVGSFFAGGSGGNLTDMGVNGEVAFARGGIVNRATAFKFFAKGGALQNGIMGEAGPEAIMPLRRGPDGSLGVMAAGGLGQPTQVHLQVINNTGTAVKSSVSQGSDGSIRLMLDAVDEEMASRIGNGQGATVQALQARFNLRPSLG